MAEQTVKEKFLKAMGTKVASDLKIIAAFIVNKTKTEKDNEIVDNIDDVLEEIANVADEVANLEPTEAQAKQAAVDIAKKIASLTKTKWDDRVVNFLDLFIGGK